MMQVQANGMGVQSIALYLMAQHDMTPKLDHSIFADPGREKKDTYLYAEALMDMQIQKEGWTPLVWDKRRNLYTDILNGHNSSGHKFADIPAYSESSGMIRRQCTNQYKIRVVDYAIRDIQGKRPNQTFDPVSIWFGISVDEIDRMSAPHRKNVTHVYPFCGYYNDGSGFKELNKINWNVKMTRYQIIKWLEDNDYRVPPKSSCVFCPFQTNKNWKDLKENHKEDFAAAVKVDEAIRNLSARGEADKIYLHKSKKPLAEANFNEEQTELNFDCFGYCGI